MTLTDREARELLRLLNTLVESREFVEACYFVEGLSEPGLPNERQLRELFLVARKRRGRKRALASIHWGQFLVRLGLLDPTNVYTRAQKMTLDHFLDMERKLFESTGMHPLVLESLLRQVYLQRTDLEAARRGKRSLGRGFVKSVVTDPFVRGIKGPGHVSVTRISAAITVVANASVLFTTRDWGVTGTLSTMAGALAAASIKDP